MPPPKLVTFDATNIVTLDEAKSHLRVDSNAEDGLITLYIDAAVSHIDGLFGTLGMSISNSVWEQEYDGFTDDMYLPFSPIGEVSSVTYGGIAVTGFQLLKNGRKNFVRAASSETWPTTEDVVKIQFAGGFSVTPPSIKAAVLLHIGTLYANRESVIIGTISSTLPLAYDALLAPYRVWAG